MEKQRMKKVIMCMCAFLMSACWILTALAAKAGGKYLSPLTLVADNEGKTLYVAEATAKQVAVFNVTAGKVAKVISLPEQPSGLALAPDGSLLYVTTAGPN
jgi:DNA-binding beta-propeller fold protein YncE